MNSDVCGECGYEDFNTDANDGRNRFISCCGQKFHEGCISNGRCPMCQSAFCGECGLQGANSAMFSCCRESFHFSCTSKFGKCPRCRKKKICYICKVGGFTPGDQLGDDHEANEMMKISCCQKIFHLGCLTDDHCITCNEIVIERCWHCKLAGFAEEGREFEADEENDYLKVSCCGCLFHLNCLVDWRCLRCGQEICGVCLCGDPEGNDDQLLRCNACEVRYHDKHGYLCPVCGEGGGDSPNCAICGEPCTHQFFNCCYQSQHLECAGEWKCTICSGSICTDCLRNSYFGCICNNSD